MAIHNQGEDSFSDDDLDALPHDALAELEQNAIQFTQAQPARSKVPPSSDYGDEFEDEDLDDAVVIDESRSTPALNPTFQRYSTHPTQHEQFRQQRYGTISNPGLANRQRQDNPPPPQFAQANRLAPRIPIPQHESMIAEQGSQPSAAAAADDKESLHRQIQELIRERNSLKEDLNAKAGEIAIVRSKQEKAVKEHEREMVAIRKINEDRLAKQQKALEAARIAEKNATIERDFIRQDLAEESERVRRLNRQKEAEKKDGVNVITPKKQKAFSHRDGFDDDEIEILSPSKLSPSKFQRRPAGSPSKAGKRKRKAAESPAGALEVTNDEPLIEHNTQQGIVLDEATLERLSVQDDRFDFLGTMLDHRRDSRHLRTLEELCKYALPSSPNESFQSIILGKIPSLGYKKPNKDLPIDFCEMLISLWSKCMEEKYLTPIYLLLDMLTLALELKTTAVAPAIIDILVPAAQLAIDPIAISRFQGKSAEPLDKQIDVTACLSVLYIAALGCMSDQQHITRFWKMMRWDLILIMLSPNQPVPDYELYLHLLSTSVLKDTFGAITGDSTQSLQTVYILDRITLVLEEIPYLPQSQENPGTDRLDIQTTSKLRLLILHLMTGMTRSPFASKAIASHPSAIGRLVSLMSNELDVLYDYGNSHEQSARIISLSIRLLYHLVTKYDSMIDMQKKLAVIHGGAQKYLLCLARLNFSEEDLVLESGIDPDVAGFALELLELVVTPEEGDAIHSAFSSQ